MLKWSVVGQLVLCGKLEFGKYWLAKINLNPVKILTSRGKNSIHGNENEVNPEKSCGLQKKNGGKNHSVIGGELV